MLWYASCCSLPIKSVRRNVFHAVEASFLLFYLSELPVLSFSQLQPSCCCAPFSLNFWKAPSQEPSSPRTQTLQHFSGHSSKEWSWYGSVYFESHASQILRNSLLFRINTVPPGKVRLVDRYTIDIVYKYAIQYKTHYTKFPWSYRSIAFAKHKGTILCRKMKAPSFEKDMDLYNAEIFVSFLCTVFFIHKRHLSTIDQVWVDFLDKLYLFKRKVSSLRENTGTT